MGNHTAGPWTVFKVDPDEYEGIEGDDKTQTIIVFGTVSDDGGVRGRTEEERHANARLIAAAPELLTALERMEAYERGESSLCWADCLLAARAAIAKAKGEA